MIQLIIITIYFFAQPDIPYELLGSNKYHDRAIAVAYLSKKFSVDDFKLFQIAEKSPDLEAATNAMNILKNRFTVDDVEGYPCIFFMGLKKVDIYSANYPFSSLNLLNPLHAFIISFIKSKTNDVCLTHKEQKELTQLFIIELRFKYKVPVSEINKWLMKAWDFENEYNKRIDVHEEIMDKLFGMFRP